MPVNQNSLVSNTYSSLPKIHTLKYNFEPKPKIKKKFRRLQPAESEPILMPIKQIELNPQVYTAKKKYRFKKLNFKAQYRKINEENN